MRAARRSLRPVHALGLLFAILVTLPAIGDPIDAVFFDLGNTLVEDRGDGVFVVRDGAAATVAGLQGLGIGLGIITNVPAGWDLDDLRALLEEPEFLDQFDPVVLSSQAPAPKPDPRIYTHAHGLLTPAVAITATAFVGETLAEIADAEVDPTSGARSVGMIGIHLSAGPPSPLADETVAPDDLPAIVDLVRASRGIFGDGFETGDTSAWDGTSSVTR
ncbi:MAG: hypothetical protein AAF604_00100 [Acidobacteriota bacterium]